MHRQDSSVWFLQQDTNTDPLPEQDRGKSPEVLHGVSGRPGVGHRGQSEAQEVHDARRRDQSQAGRVLLLLLLLLQQSPEALQRGTSQQVTLQRDLPHQVKVRRELDWDVCVKCFYLQARQQSEQDSHSRLLHPSENVLRGPAEGPVWPGPPPPPLGRGGGGAGGGRRGGHGGECPR